MTTIAMPHLTHGWEPEADLEPGDTVVRRYLLHFADYVASAALANGGTVRRNDRLVIADAGRAANFYNSALLLRPPVTDDDWAGALDQVETTVDRAGTGDVYLWSVTPTPDLHGRGWSLMGHPPLLVRPPGGALPPARSQRLSVDNVDDEVGLEEAARVAVDGYPFEDLQPYRSGSLFAPALLDDPRWRFWIARSAGRAVGVGVLFVSHGFAQLALGATLPAARRTGAWYALVRERLLAAPDLISGSVFSDDSRPGIERLGYLPILRFTLWRRSRD